MRTIFTLVVISISLHLSAQSVKDSLTYDLENIAIESDIPGFSIAIVSKEKILYKKGFGYSNQEQQTPFTENTIINIGSITKTLIGVSLMTLIDKGKIKLDDPINKFLPFNIRTPYHPDVDITIRQLATHTSSLTDGLDDMLIEKTYLFLDSINFKKEELPEGYEAYFEIYRKNKPISMERFLHNTFCESREWYSNDNFNKSAPGTQYQYTNLGATLLAFIIEKVSGKSFSEYTKTEILDELGMNNSFWDISKIPSEHLASHYLSNGLLIPQYELITYPDGGLFTSIADFSLFLIDMIKGLNKEGRLLTFESYKQMMSNQLTQAYFPNGQFDTSKGLMWSVNEEGDNITMNGADPGIVSWTLFTTQGNAGIVIFINNSLYGNDSLEKDFNRIRSTIFKYVGSLLKNP